MKKMCFGPTLFCLLHSFFLCVPRSMPSLVAHVHFWNESEIDGPLVRWPPPPPHRVAVRPPLLSIPSIRGDLHSFGFIFWFWRRRRGSCPYTSRPITPSDAADPMSADGAMFVVRYPLVPESPKIPNANAALCGPRTTLPPHSGANATQNITYLRRDLDGQPPLLLCG